MPSGIKSSSTATRMQPGSARSDRRLEVRHRVSHHFPRSESHPRKKPPVRLVLKDCFVSRFGRLVLLFPRSLNVKMFGRDPVPRSSGTIRTPYFGELHVNMGSGLPWTATDVSGICS